MKDTTGNRRRTTRRFAGLMRAVIAALAVCCSGTDLADAYIDDTVRVSGDKYSDAAMAVISENGRYVAYSQSDVFDWDLPPNFYPQIWRKDLVTGEVVLISRSIGNDDFRANQGSYSPTISDDGNLIAFESDASDLVAEDVSSRQVYVRDVSAGTTQLVSRASGSAGDPGDGGSGEATISGDGNSVSFLSDSLNLDPIDVNPDNRGDVFVRDLGGQTTELVGCEDGDPCVGIEEGTWTSDGAGISDDGRFVLFQANSPQLEGGDAPCNYDWISAPGPCYRIYLRDRTAGTTELVSRADGPNGDAADGLAHLGAISGDGSTVSFTSIAGNLGPDDAPDAYDAWVRDLDEEKTILVGRADGPDGAVANRPPPYPDHPDAALWASSAGTLTDDGSAVVFTSEAGNLSPVVSQGTNQMYVRYLDQANTELVSRHDGGFAPPAPIPTSRVAGSADISGGGDYIVFGGMDAALASGAENCCIRVYRRQITGEPAPPEVGEKVQLQPDEGTVEVQIPGAIAPEELERGTQVPVGSTIDADDGALEIRSEDPDPEEPIRHMVWSDGLFVTQQGTDREALSQAILSGPLLDCDNPESITPKQLKQMGGRPGDHVLMAGRKVWGHGGKGHQSKGGKSSASVRGTEWLVWDTCDGRTVTYVVEGRVEVDDFDRGRSVFVNPGELYVAPGPPDAAITSGPSGTISNSTPSFWFSAGEPWAAFECRMDEGGWIPCSSPMTSAELSAGTHTFSVRAIDDAGSVGVTPVIRSFQVGQNADPQPLPEGFVPPEDLDATPPKTRITSDTDERIRARGRSAEVRFRFSADEPGATFQCNLDDSGWKRCDSPKTYRLRPGAHRFSVRAVDSTGNVDATPARQSLRVLPRR